MTWLTGPAVLLLVTLCVSSARDNVTLEVIYPQRTMTLARGSSVKLSCEAHYNFKLCGVLHVVWCHITKQSAELTNPSKYFTTVNETLSRDVRDMKDMRRRRVLTEILDLTPDDNGAFQCMASCDSGESAMGHFIQITVED